MIENVLIVGGGPSGTAAAIALQQKGVYCEIVEKSTEWQPVGIGIALRNSPLRALAKIGLHDACVAVGYEHPQQYYCDVHGEMFSSVKSEALVPGGPGLITLPRATLHKVFVDKLRELEIPVHLGTTVTRMEQDPDGVNVTLSNGVSGRFDLVVGADGLHSQMRAEYFPEAPSVFPTGQNCWRAGGQLPAEIDGYYILKNGRQTVGLVPMGENRHYLWLLEPTDPERIPSEKLLDVLCERLSPYGPKVQAAAALFDGDVDCRPMQTMMLPAPWNRGRLLLIGDAVHTTTPHMAYGVGIALEDSVVLGELVARGLEGDELGKAFVARRFDRCKLIVDASVQVGAWELEPPEDPMAAVKLIRNTLVEMDKPF